MLPKITEEIPLKIALRDLYETKFGIFNHVSKSSGPFASVSYHESENFMHDERLKRLVKKFYLSGIREITGMTLVEFVNETTDTVETLIDVCESIMREKNQKEKSDIDAITAPPK